MNYATTLLRWYSKNKRSLPWRRTRDPYRIWISEIMLQQTQVDRVVHFYNQFIKRFPNVRSLASSSWRQVLPYWRGLGYYRRAQNILKTAKILEAEHGCRLPKTRAELERLPGIGGYTSAAICSYAYGKDVPAIDTNLKRVASRVFGEKAAEKNLHALFIRSPGKGPLLNQVLMDLGATICKARAPKCTECPLSSSCQFAKKPIIPSPLRRAKAEKVVDVGIACIHRDGLYLIGKRNKKRGGLWEFPGGKREKGEDIRHCIQREVKEEVGVEVAVRPPFLIKTMRSNNLTFRLNFCRCQILRGIPKRNEHTALKWAAPDELLEIAFPEANREATTKLKNWGKGEKGTDTE